MTRYLVKYVVSPPIRKSRIVDYNRERAEVTYWYRSHLDGGKKKKVTISREQFIGRMVQHILPKGFHRIRYYGLQATCVLKKVREKIWKEALIKGHIGAIKENGRRKKEKRIEKGKKGYIE